LMVWQKPDGTAGGAGGVGTFASQGKETNTKSAGNRSNATRVNKGKCRLDFMNVLAGS
jgi:hypothetical protein